MEEEEEGSSSLTPHRESPVSLRGLYAAGFPPRRLQAAPAELAIKLLNVSVADIAVHYYEAHRLLQSATTQVAAAFGIDPERVLPLQLRPDERNPTKETIWTFKVRGGSIHDLFGQLREMFRTSGKPFGEWRFGSRKVVFEPLLLGAVGVEKEVALPSPLPHWQRPGVSAFWQQKSEQMTLTLPNVDLGKELEADRASFEQRLLRLRDFVVSSVSAQDNKDAVQLSAFDVTPSGTTVSIAPLTPSKEQHLKQLHKWLEAVQKDELTKHMRGAERASSPILEQTTPGQGEFVRDLRLRPAKVVTEMERRELESIQNASQDTTPRQTTATHKPHMLAVTTRKKMCKPSKKDTEGGPRGFSKKRTFEGCSGMES